MYYITLYGGEKRSLHSNTYYTPTVALCSWKRDWCWPGGLGGCIHPHTHNPRDPSG